MRELSPPTLAPTEITDLSDLGSNIKLVWPDPSNLMLMNVTITPSEGRWRNASFLFSIEVGEDYPIKAPKVLCKTAVWHPNIDMKGNVCLNILRAEWVAVLDVTTVINGLCFLFYEPNPNDPLNHGASHEPRRTLTCAFCSCLALTLIPPLCSLRKNRIRGGEADAG